MKNLLNKLYKRLHRGRGVIAKIRNKEELASFVEKHVDGVIPSDARLFAIAVTNPHITINNQGMCVGNDINLIRYNVASELSEMAYKWINIGESRGEYGKRKPF